VAKEKEKEGIITNTALDGVGIAAVSTGIGLITTNPELLTQGIVITLIGLVVIGLKYLSRGK